MIGDILPIQIIDSRGLSSEENIWLKDLDNKLEASEIQRITAEITKRGKAARIRAYLNVITNANKESLLEALKMSDTALTLEKVFEEAGLLKKWEERGKANGLVEGEEKKAVEIAKNMLRNGFSPEQIAELSGLDITKVKSLSAAL